MKKVGIIFGLLCTLGVQSFSASAQSIRYSRFYDSNQGAEILKEAVILNDGSLMVTGNTSNSNGSCCGRSFNIVIDPAGELEHALVREAVDVNIIPKGLVVSSNGLSVYEAGYICDYSVPSLGYCDFYLAKLDQTGDTLFTKVYARPDTSDYLLDIVQTRPNKLMLIGWTYNDTVAVSSAAQLMFITVDTLGNELNRVVWGGAGTDYVHSGLTIDSLGHVIMVGYTKSFPTLNNGRSWVVKTDSIGNVIWHRTYTGIGASTANGIRAAMLPDGNIIISGGKSGNGYLQKIDTDGNEIWIKEYEVPGPQGLWDCKGLADGTIVSCGVTVGDDGSQAGWLIKTDEHGDTLWTRTYNPSSLIDFIRFMLLMPNGDIVMIGNGRAPGQTNQDGWILRVDSMGCLEEGCHLVGVDELGSSKVVADVWPNPASQFIYIEWQWQGDAEILLLDMTGKEILRKQSSEQRDVVDVSGLPNGLYVLQLVQSEKRSSLRIVVQH